MAAKVERTCANKRCSVKFLARKADIARGWGKFCSKTCKAVVQEARTGQYANLQTHAEFDPTDCHLFSDEAFDDSGFHK